MKAHPLAVRLVLFWLLLGAWSRAELVTFQLIPSQSTLALSGTATYGGTTAPFAPQGAGALIAAYSGFIVADVTANTLQLRLGTSISADTLGDWHPGDGGSGNPYDASHAQANYGYNLALLSGYPAVSVAMRDVDFKFTDLSAHALVGGQFSTGGMVAQFSAGHADTNYSSNVSLPTVGATTTQATSQKGTLVTAGGKQTITIPLSFTFNYTNGGVVTTATFSGSLVAVRAIPEPSVAGLWLLGAGGLGLRRFRRAARG